jgi:hypothetical protein
MFFREIKMDKILELVHEADQKNQEVMSYIDNGETDKAMQNLALNYDLLGTIYELLKDYNNA